MSASRTQHKTKGDEVRSTLLDRTRTSQELSRRAADVLAMEVVGTVDMPSMIYISDAEGCRMTDVDGNSYIDLTMGFGPHVLGHRAPVVAEAIRRQADAAWHVGIHNPLQAELASLLVDAGRCVEQVVFCNSGTEATMYTIRAARALTGRRKVAIFDGSYHGAHDYALTQAAPDSPRLRPRGIGRGNGIPVEATDTVLVLPYDEEAAFRLIEEHQDDLAVVMVEPVQNSTPRVDIGPFLTALRQVCADCSVLFALDEVVTGFRLAHGGGQEFFDLAPDLAVYGKAIGGGIPIGAVGGRAELMEIFKARTRTDAIFAGGTFSGNPLAMAAGAAAVGHLRDHPEIYSHLHAQGDRFARAINRFCAEHQFPAQVMNAGSMFHLRFQEGPIRSSRDFRDDHAGAEREFYLHLLRHGVIVPGIHLAFFSAAHSSADVDTVIDAFEQSFLDIRADGLL